MTENKPGINGKHILAVIDNGFSKDWFDHFLVEHGGAKVDILYRHDLANEAIDKRKYDAVVTDLCLWEDSPQPQAITFIAKCIENRLPLVVTSAARWEGKIPQFERLVFVQTTEVSGGFYPKIKAAILGAIEKVKEARLIDGETPLDSCELHKAHQPKAQVLFIGDNERGKQLEKELYVLYNVDVKTSETVAGALESLDRYSAVVIHEHQLDSPDYPKLAEICKKTGLEIVVQTNDASKGSNVFHVISDPIDEKGIGTIIFFVEIYEREKMIEAIKKRGRGTVLIVENEESQRFIIETRIGKIADLIFAEDLDGGMEKIKGKKIDVVIFDLKGVGQNLEEFCNEMYEQGIPMIVYTGAGWNSGTPAFDSVELVDKMHGIEVLMRAVFKKLMNQKPENAPNNDVTKLLSYDWHIATPTEKWLRKMDADEALIRRTKITFEKGLKEAGNSPYEASKREMNILMDTYLAARRKIKELNERKENPGEKEAPKRLLK